MDFPETLQEFQARFPDDEACWEALRGARWQGGFRCPRCGHRKSSWLAERRLAQCRSCRYQCSVTAGTIFHSTKVPLRTWFWALFFVARHKNSISAKQLQRDTGLGSYETAWTMLHKIRSALRPRAQDRLAGSWRSTKPISEARSEAGAEGARRARRRSSPWPSSSGATPPGGSG